jgi:hypothetical protein
MLLITSSLSRLVFNYLSNNESGRIYKWFNQHPLNVCSASTRLYHVNICLTEELRQMKVTKAFQKVTNLQNRMCCDRMQ